MCYMYMYECMQVGTTSTMLHDGIQCMYMCTLFYIICSNHIFMLLIEDKKELRPCKHVSVTDLHYSVLDVHARGTYMYIYNVMYVYTSLVDCR